MRTGIGNLKLNINQIHVETPSVGSSGVTRKASIQVDATLENSSKLLELPENENGDYIDEIDFGSFGFAGYGDRKSTRLNSSHSGQSRMPSSA